MLAVSLPYRALRLLFGQGVLTLAHAGSRQATNPKNRAGLIEKQSRSLQTGSGCDIDLYCFLGKDPNIMFIGEFCYICPVDSQVKRTLFRGPAAAGQSLTKN